MVRQDLETRCFVGSDLHCFFFFVINVVSGMFVGFHWFNHFWCTLGSGEWSNFIRDNHHRKYLRGWSYFSNGHRMQLFKWNTWNGWKPLNGLIVSIPPTTHTHTHTLTVAFVYIWCEGFVLNSRALEQFPNLSCNLSYYSTSLSFTSVNVLCYFVTLNTFTIIYF